MTQAYQRASLKCHRLMIIEHLLGIPIAMYIQVTNEVLLDAYMTIGSTLSLCNCFEKFA